MVGNTLQFLKIKSYWDPKKKIGVCADWFVKLESISA